MSALLAALSFLTVFPARPSLDAGVFGRSRAFFPLVGLLLGGGLAALDWVFQAIFPVWLASAVLLAALTAVTRGLHLEGFIDCCDALWGGFSRERRLEILKDPHVGAFAIIGGVLLMLLTWAALASIGGQTRMLVLILFPCLSRWGVLLAMSAFPYARPQGMGTAFTQGTAPWQVALGLATASLASLLLGLPGLLMLGAASLVAWLSGRWASRLLGGLTGDTYGAINEIGALTVLLCAVAAHQRGWMA